MQIYEVDDEYVPTKAVLEVLAWFDQNEEILKAKENGNVRRKNCGCAVDNFCDSCSGFDNWHDEQT